MRKRTKRGTVARMGTELALAPAAGAGIGKLLADEILVRPGVVKQLASWWLECCEATRTYYDKQAGGNVTEPDFRTRLAAIMGLIAHMEGEPIKRVIHQHLGGNGTVDPLAALQESPALRDAARRMLEKAEYRTGGGARSKARAAGRRQAEKVAELEIE